MRNTSTYLLLFVGLVVSIITGCLIGGAHPGHIGLQPDQMPQLATTSPPAPVPPQPSETSPEAATAQNIAIPNAPVFTEIHGELKNGETLSASFRHNQVPEDAGDIIIRQLRKHLDLRSLQPGHTYTIILDENNQLARCNYEVSPLEIYTLDKTLAGYTMTQEHIQLEERTVTLSGQLESSLFAAFNQLGEQAKLLYAFADIFGSKIDFNTEAKEGDRFTITFTKYFKDDEFVAYGKIKYAAYNRQQAGDSFEAFYYASPTVPGTYFDREGKEVGTFFLRSPVPVARVTSKFTQQRKHPILGYVRPHLGVDLAAPYNTPIMAAGDAKIAFMGRNGDYGNQIILDHGNGYRTHYGHLASFKKGLKKGSKVSQKAIIGYVGATGLATGPHVCYRFEQNGVFKNPFAVRFKPRSELTQLQRAEFDKRIAALTSVPATNEGIKVVNIQQVLVSPETPLAFL